jgi:hypothetical protein
MLSLVHIGLSVPELEVNIHIHNLNYIYYMTVHFSPRFPVVRLQKSNFTDIGSQFRMVAMFTFYDM